MKSQKWIIALSLAASMVAVEARATTLASEDFGSHASGTTLTGNGTGWAANWSGDVGDPVNVRYDNPGTDFAASGKIYSPSGTSFAALGGTSANNGARVSRTLNTSSGGPFSSYLSGGNIGADGTTIYVAWASKMTEAPGTNPSDFYQGFEVDRGGTDDNANRIIQVSSDGSLGTQAITLRGNNPTTGVHTEAAVIPAASYSTNVAALEAIHYFVLKLSFGAGNNDTASIFMDPTLNALEGAPTATISGLDLSFDRLAIASHVDRPLYQVDDIRIGTSYADVVGAVPEPSSVALAGLGLMALLARRRRSAIAG